MGNCLSSSPERNFRKCPPDIENRKGVSTSRGTSGERRKDRNKSGQRGNKFNTSYGYKSVVVTENSSVVKPKC